MGNLFSAFTENNKEKNDESYDEGTYSSSYSPISSNIKFSNFGEERKKIKDPQEGDPCALYIEGFNTEWSNKAVKSFLVKNKIKCSKVYKEEGLNFATIYFDSIIDRSEAYRILTTVRFQNMILYVVPLTKSFSHTQEKCKKLKNRNKVKKSTVDYVTPWHSIDYAEQVRQKVFKYSKIMKKLPNSRSFGLIDIIECDNLKYYVNDVELAIGWNSDRKISIGFNIGSKQDDYIVSISKCINIPECSLTISKRIRTFILRSGYSPFNRLKKHGLWKFARIRTSTDKKVLLTLGTYGKIPSELIPKIIQEFKDIDSLYYAETTDGESFGFQYKLHHLNGIENLTDEINGFAYQVYPTTIFPKSTTMFEQIIQQIVLLGSLDNQTLVIDVDAGIGLYSFPVSNTVSHVISFEKNEELFEKMVSNKELNQIENAELKNDYVENFIDTINHSNDQKVVVIIHSPHSGIRKKALYAIQNIKNLSKIVFVTTNPEKIIQDCNSIFLKSVDQPSPQYFVDSYVAVDTAPHTDKATVVLSISC